MAKRRGNGEGYIGKTCDGHWEARITKGYDANGKQQFKYFSAKTRQEVAEKLNNYIVERQKGAYIEPTKLTVGQWLDTFYQSHIINKVKTSTRVGDESVIERHLKPYFGNTKLTELKGPQIQKVYNQLLLNGRVDGKGGLNPKTIKNIHLVLHKALEQAVKDDLLIKNPLKSVTLPRMINKEIEILTPDEQKRLEKECSEHPWGMAILLTLYSGLRLGEVLALQNADLDFEKNTISINKQLSRLKDYSPNAPAKTKLYLRQETKTSSSNRTIAIAHVIMDKLKEYKDQQELNRKKWGKTYNNFNMVFCREDGYYIDPATFRDFYLRTLKKADIERKSFHTIRHSFATRALESNVNIKVVSELLGHASIQITLDTYSHVSHKLQQEAMQKIADIYYDK